MSDRAYWVAWSQIRGVGPILLKRLDEQFSGLDQAWQADVQELQQVAGLGIKLAEAIVQQRRQQSPETALSRLEAKAPYFLTPSDAAYPGLLYSIADPPPVLFFRGNLSLLEEAQTRLTVGIVGTRSPSEYGRRWTRKIVRSLVRHGSLIISGMAEGIDREAHQTVLGDAGKTIGVLGTGVDIAYPRSNQSLQAHLVEAGLVISEYPDGTPPDRGHFPRRNRIIAGLCRALLVTEAPLRSGALITARLANDYGREVYALPGSLDNPCAQGCLHLIAQGAQLILDSETLLQGLGSLPVLDSCVDPPVIAEASQTDIVNGLSPDLQQVFHCLGSEPLLLDHLLLQLPLTTGAVLSALAQLEIEGLITQLPGGQYQRSLS